MLLVNSHNLTFQNNLWLVFYAKGFEVTNLGVQIITVHRGTANLPTTISFHSFQIANLNNHLTDRHWQKLRRQQLFVGPLSTTNFWTIRLFPTVCRRRHHHQRESAFMMLLFQQSINPQTLRTKPLPYPNPNPNP
jgi:hypothetical protein